MKKDIKLNKIIDDYSNKITEWVNIINEYNSMFVPHKETSDGVHIELIYKTADVLAAIVDLYFKYGSFKDSFDNSKMYLHYSGPELIIESKKTNITFYLGIDNNGIYLRTYLRYAENLRYMDDNFYRDMLSLMDLGKFDIQENQSYSKEITTKYDGIFNKSLFGNCF